MGEEKGLYGKQMFWSEKQNIPHGGSEVSNRPMVFPEGEALRVVGEIKGNLAACAGNLVITINGKLFDVEVPIDTLTIAAAGVATVVGQKLIDIKGFEVITGSAAYTDAAGRIVETQVYVGVPYK